MASKHKSMISFFDHVKEIKYQIKPSMDCLIITIQDLRLKKRYTATTPITLHTQDSLKSPISLFECFYKQFISDGKTPKEMLCVQTEKDITLKIIFTYPGAPVKLLRFPCLSQNLPNPQIQPFKEAIQHMVLKTFEKYWKNFQPIMEKTQKQMINEIRQQGDKWVTKLGYKMDEIIQINNKCYEDIVHEKQKGIKQFKQHLQGLLDKCTNNLKTTNHKLIMEIVHKTVKVQESLISIMKNQQETYNKWQDIQNDLIYKIQTMNDELYTISQVLKEKLDSRGVSSLLVKLKLIQPPKEQQLLIKDQEKVDINLNLYTHNIHSIDIKEQTKQEVIDAKPIFSESTCFIQSKP